MSKLSEQEIQQWYLTNKIPENGQKVINEIRNSEPARKVRSGRSNVPGTYPSNKMKHTVQFESHTVELPGILVYDTDSDVKEYWDQPGPIKLKYPSLHNKVVGILHVPDFLVIRTNCAGWEEWKQEEDLEKLAIKSPNRFVKENGIWRCPPGEKYAEPLGLYYKIRSSAEINWVYKRNIDFLEDYLREEEQIVPTEEKQRILSYVNANLGISVFDLIRTYKVNPDYLYSLMDSACC